MDSEYIKTRKELLKAEYDANIKRQSWLEGAFAELSEAEKTTIPQEKAPKETK
jgi:hypothetical protein